MYIKAYIYIYNKAFVLIPSHSFWHLGKLVLAPGGTCFHTWLATCAPLARRTLYFTFFTTFETAHSTKSLLHILHYI